MPNDSIFKPRAKPLKPGNLPNEIRYKVPNEDGSISTVRTISFGADEGEVLVPTVVEGRILSDEDAIDHYYRTGENFGIFQKPEEATAYAEDLHNYHAGLMQNEGVGREDSKMSTMPIEQRPDKWGRYPADMNNQNYSPWPQQQQPQQKPKGGGLFGGGKLQTKDIISMILGTIGDGIAMHNGQRPMAAPMMMQRFQDQREQAAREEKLQAQYQAALAAGYKPNEATALQNGVPLREGPKPGSFEWWQTASDDQRKVYDDYDPETVATANGPVRVPRNRPQIGATVPIDQLGGATMQNTPAPELGQNGQPQILTRQQYQATVNAMGKQRTDEWARKYNIRIGD